MSSTAKTGITLVIILVVIVIGWVLYNNSVSMKAPAPIETGTPAAQASSTASTAAPVSPLEGTGMSAQTDASASALEQDTSALDKQIESLSSDSSSVDQSINATTK